MKQVFNFCSGPAMLPVEVMKKAQQEFCDWHDMGVSVMELSHRSKQYIAVAEQAEQDLRDLLQIPENYKVLFLQGGARTQFAAVPMNLIGATGRACYVLTGQWSNYAAKEAERYGEIQTIDGLIREDNQTHLKTDLLSEIEGQPAYIHFTPNETIEGIEYLEMPDFGDHVVVADMSSTLLSRPIDVSRYGVIYAGAQKNIGPSGLTVVIVREDLLNQQLDLTPSMLTYSVQANASSMYNTPATYSWYLSGLVFQWLKEQGGVAAMAAINQRKAAKLYQAIDESRLYSNNIGADCRSWMNIPFILSDESLNSEFLTQSEQAGLLTLKGHRLVGGMRASIYNAMPEAGIDALIEFMQQFEQVHG